MSNIEEIQQNMYIVTWNIIALDLLNFYKIKNSVYNIYTGLLLTTIVSS